MQLKQKNHPVVAIVGCGWFGLPLAKYLLSQGYYVKGTKRSKQGVAQLLKYGIAADVLDLSQELTVEDSQAFTEFLQVDYLVVNIPPNMRYGSTDYLQRLQRLASLLADQTLTKIVFVSTTGVYPPKDGVATERDATPFNERSQVLLSAEQLWLAKQNCCVIRFAGLVGPQRHPGRFMAGKQQLDGANVAVNIVHLDDCIHAVSVLLRHGCAGEVYNLCAPHHPTKQRFYHQAAIQLNLAPPTFSENELPSKCVDGSRIVNETPFDYQYTDPMLMLSDC